VIWDIINLQLPGSTFTNRAMLVVCLHDIDKGTAKNICREFKSRDACILLLFYTGKMEEKARMVFVREKALMTSISDRLVEFRLTRRDARVLIGTALSIERNIDVDKDIMEREITIIATTNLRIESKINEWLNKAKKRGILIREFAKSRASSDEMVINALEYYIDSYPELPLTPTEAFQKHKRIDDMARAGERKKKYKFKFKPYDWESPIPLYNITKEDLVRNQLVTNAGDEKYKVNATPQEVLIVEYLREKEKVKLEYLKKCFINLTTHREAPVEYFIELLWRKGLITEENGTIRLNRSIHEVYDNVRKKIDEVKELIKEFSTMDEFSSSKKTYAYLYETKLRGHWVITLDKCLELMEFLFKILNEKYNLLSDSITLDNPKDFLMRAPNILQPARIIEMIYNLRLDELKREAEKYHEALELLENMKDKLKSVEEQLEDLIKNLELNDLKYSDIDEYSELNSLFEKAVAIHKLEPNNPEVLKQELASFSENADKLEAIKAIKRQFNEEYDKIRSNIEDIWRIFWEYKSIKEDLSSKYSTLKEQMEGNRLKVGNRLLYRLSTLLKGSEGGES